ncbi:MAG: YHS domain-containing protein [Gemmatimonadota bacterium]
MESKTVQDPVCGMQFSASDAEETLEYEGVTYYFCCQGCRMAFEEDPQRYLGRDA